MVRRVVKDRRSSALRKLESSEERLGLSLGENRWLEKHSTLHHPNPPPQKKTCSCPKICPDARRQETCCVGWGQIDTQLVFLLPIAGTVLALFWKESRLIFHMMRCYCIAHCSHLFTSQCWQRLKLIIDPIWRETRAKYNTMTHWPTLTLERPCGLTSGFGDTHFFTQRSPGMWSLLSPPFVPHVRPVRTRRFGLATSVNGQSPAASFCHFSHMLFHHLIFGQGQDFKSFTVCCARSAD